MKSFIKFLVIICFLTTSENSLAQLYIKMADSVDVWSAPQQFSFTARTGISGTISARVKFFKKKATTCMLEVEVTNIGTTEFRGWFKVTANQMGELTSTVNSLNGNLQPKYYVKSNLEMRECLPKGAKGKSDLEKCQLCDPKLYFFGNIIK